MHSFFLGTVLIGLLSTSFECQFYSDEVYSGAFADCTRRNLSSVPIYLPCNTTSLDLSHNNIAVLNVTHNVTLRELKYLDLSNNLLESIQDGAFTHFEGLEELYLHNNKLTLDNGSFPDHIFRPLQNLLKLHLHNNSYESYPETLFSSLKSVQELKIDTFQEGYFGFGFSKMLNLQRLLLGFKGCKLERIGNRTFETLSNISLSLIDFDHCPVRNLEVGSFLPLKHLKYLYLSNTEGLAPTSAMLSMYGLQGRNVSVVEMNNIVLVRNMRNKRLTERILTHEVLKYVINVCIKYFSMSSNQLLWMGKTAFENSVLSQCIQHLDFSNNDFYGDIYYASTIPSLKSIVFLNMSRFNIYGKKSLVYNVNYQTRRVELTLPNTLKGLCLDGISADGLNINLDIHIYNARSLQNISIAYNHVSGFTYRVFGLEKVTFIDMSGNNCSSMSPDFFRSFPNLEILTMDNVEFGETYLLLNGKRLLSPLIRLRILNLRNNNIRITHTQLFSSIPIEEVTFSQNRLESIPFDLSTTPNLTHLDLGFNSLTVLSDREMEQLDDLALRNNLTLNLVGNLLSCGCQSLDFIMWLYNTNVEVDDRSRYMCQMSDGSVANTSYIRDHYEQIWMSCNGSLFLSVTFVLYAIAGLGVIFIYGLVRQKTFFINTFLRLFGYGPLPPTLRRTDFPNDAYIGYSDADYQYICHTVRNHLENRHGLKLFIKDRDTIPGGQIADDIISGIDSSWTTVLFLTAAFLDDQWCRFIINRAVYSTTRSQASVLVVLFGDVMLGDIPPALFSVVEEQNIFRTENYRENEDRLWKDIHERILYT